MIFELLLLGLLTAASAWVVFFGGAMWLEDTIKSAFLVHPSAPFWSATAIRVYVALAWCGSVLLWAM